MRHQNGRKVNGVGAVERGARGPGEPGGVGGRDQYAATLSQNRLWGTGFTGEIGCPNLAAHLLRPAEETFASEGWRGEEGGSQVGCRTQVSRPDTDDAVLSLPSPPHRPPTPYPPPLH